MTATKARKLFVNLAVNDLPRTKAFFSKLGFAYDPQFTNDEAACMPISDEAFVMLLRRDRFADFTKKEICDTARGGHVARGPKAARGLDTFQMGI